MVHAEGLGDEIARRQGMKRAKVAVARKLAVMLHRMWVTKKPYEPMRLAMGVEVT